MCRPKAEVYAYYYYYYYYYKWKDAVAKTLQGHYKIITREKLVNVSQNCGRIEMSAYACVVSSLCPVYFCSPATQRLPSTTLAIRSHPTHTGRESVDQWSRVPTGTVVKKIASITAIKNVNSVHSLQRTTPNPLSYPRLTPCVSSWSPEPFSGCTNNYICVGEAHNSLFASVMYMYISFTFVRTVYRVWQKSRIFLHFSLQKSLGGNTVMLITWKHCKLILCWWWKDSCQIYRMTMGYGKNFALKF